MMKFIFNLIILLSVTTLFNACGGKQESAITHSEQYQMRAGEAFEKAQCKPRVVTDAPAKTPLTEEDFNLYFTKRMGSYVLTEVEATVASLAPNNETHSKINYFSITYATEQTDGKILRKSFCNDDPRSILSVSGSAPSRINATNRKIVRVFSFKNSDASVMGSAEEQLIPSIDAAAESGVQKFVYAIDQTSFEFRLQFDTEENGQMLSTQLRYVYRYIDSAAGVVGPASTTGVHIGHPTRP